MSIHQLSFILNEISVIKAKGVVMEIGVGGGATSIVINKHIISDKIDRQFIAIDTFDGFTKEDISFEKTVRGKTDNYQYYRSNSLNWYKKTLFAQGIDNAIVHQIDCKSFDYKSVGPIAFCLFDVDLFKPTEFVLPLLYENLVPGGVIVVDDCQNETNIYDGAGEAYRKFLKAYQLKEEIVHGKLGVIRKPI
jgi:predicted O-methyltransferase YrrM